MSEAVEVEADCAFEHNGLYNGGKNLRAPYFLIDDVISPLEVSDIAKAGLGRQICEVGSGPR